MLLVNCVKISYSGWGRSSLSPDVAMPLNPIPSPPCRQCFPGLTSPASQARSFQPLQRSLGPASAARGSTRGESSQGRAGVLAARRQLRRLCEDPSPVSHESRWYPKEAQKGLQVLWRNPAAPWPYGKRKARPAPGPKGAQRETAGPGLSEALLQSKGNQVGARGGVPEKVQV